MPCRCRNFKRLRGELRHKKSQTDRWIETSRSSGDEHKINDIWKEGRRIIEWKALLENLRICVACRVGPVPLTVDSVKGEVLEGLGGYLYVQCQRFGCGYVNLIAYGKTYFTPESRGKGMPCFAVNTNFDKAMMGSLGGTACVNNILSSIDLKAMTERISKETEEKMEDSVETVPVESTMPVANEALQKHSGVMVKQEPQEVPERMEGLVEHHDVPTPPDAASSMRVMVKQEPQEMPERMEGLVEHHDVPTPPDAAPSMRVMVKQEPQEMPERMEGLVEHHDVPPPPDAAPSMSTAGISLKSPPPPKRQMVQPSGRGSRVRRQSRNPGAISEAKRKGIPIVCAPASTSPAKKKVVVLVVKGKHVVASKIGDNGNSKRDVSLGADKRTTAEGNSKRDVSLGEKRSAQKTGQETNPRMTAVAVQPVTRGDCSKCVHEEAVGNDSQLNQPGNSQGTVSPGATKVTTRSAEEKRKRINDDSTLKALLKAPKQQRPIVVKQGQETYLKVMPVTKYGVQEQSEGDAYRSGIGQEDWVYIPKATPRGQFKAVKLTEEATLVAFGLETTGLNRERVLNYKEKEVPPMITQIVAVEVKSGAKFSVYIKPPVPDSREAADDTGLSIVDCQMKVNGQTVTAVSLTDAMNSFIEWLKQFPNVCLVSHNGPQFDFPIIVSVLQKQQAFERFPVCAFIDSMSVFKKLLPGASLQQYDLTAALLGTTYNRNSCIKDVSMLGELLKISNLPQKDLLNHSFPPTAVANSLNFNKAKITNLPDLMVLVTDGILRKRTVENIAGSGLSLENLATICHRSGEDGLRFVFMERNSEGWPRVTGFGTILQDVAKIVQYFKERL